MIRFVIRFVPLQEFQPLIDRFSQSQLPHQLMHDRHTAIGCTAVPLRKLAVDVASLEHRLLTAETVALFALLLVEPSLHPLLATLPLLRHGA